MDHFILLFVVFQFGIIFVCLFFNAMKNVGAFIGISSTTSNYEMNGHTEQRNIRKTITTYVLLDVKIRATDKFKYLGFTLSKPGTTEEEIKGRLGRLEQGLDNYTVLYLSLIHI